MGGHAAGEVAANLTIETVRGLFQANSTVEGLNNAIEEANRNVLADARAHPERFGMGTTVIAVGLTHDDAGDHLPHAVQRRRLAGLSAARRRAAPASEDHSVAEEWVRMGRLTPEEALTHPRRHQLTRALGIEGELDIDVLTIQALPGDRILLCSDGLSNELSDEVLAQMASSDDPLDEVVAQLVQAAREAGGHDNISAILVEFDEVSVAPTPIKRTMSMRPPVRPDASAGVSRRHRHRLLTWRVGAAVVVLAAVGVAFVLVMHWFAYSSYYLGDDAGTIAVFQGQPNGVLWYKPIVVSVTTFPSTHLIPVDYAALEATISEPSLPAALNYAEFLNRTWHLAGGHPITSTTTTIATTTTVKAAG